MKIARTRLKLRLLCLLVTILISLPDVLWAAAQELAEDPISFSASEFFEPIAPEEYPRRPLPEHLVMQERRATAEEAQKFLESQGGLWDKRFACLQAIDEGQWLARPVAGYRFEGETLDTGLRRRRSLRTTVLDFGTPGRISIRIGPYLDEVVRARAENRLMGPFPIDRTETISFRQRGDELEVENESGTAIFKVVYFPATRELGTMAIFEDPERYQDRYGYLCQPLGGRFVWLRVRFQEPKLM